MADNYPLITVITATYNLNSDSRLNYFRECAESVHNQTYPNIEHIVADGASTDGSLEVIQEYEAKGWLKCYSEPDAGIDDGYNHGLAHANGKYVFFMNSDDKYFSDDALAECVKKMEEENADYCYGTEEKYDRNGRFVHKWLPRPEVFFHDMPFSHQTMGVRLDVLRKLGNYNTDCGFGGDYDLVIKLIVGGYKGVEVNKTISYYRLGGISSQTENQAKLLSVIYVLAQRIVDFSHLFYKDIDIDQCVNIYYQARYNPSIFPPYYLQKLIRFMVQKKLKYFDYDRFVDYVTSLADVNITPTRCSNRKVIKLLYLIPLIKIKSKMNITRIYLFGFIPFLKIKSK